MEQEKSKNGVIALLVVIIVILAILVVLFATGKISLNSSDTTNNNETGKEVQDVVDKDEPEEVVQDELGKDDTFTASTNSGIVEVIGYPVRKEKTDMNGTKYDYVYFYIVETKNTDFQKYIASMTGNSYVSDNSIGLGCVNNGKLEYYNSSNQYGMKKYELSEVDTNKILNATSEKPVRLKLERLLYTSGTDAPMCYSHITNVNVNS